MRAAVHSSYGDPDVVRVTEHPRPEPGPGEVLVVGGAGAGGAGAGAEGSRGAGVGGTRGDDDDVRDLAPGDRVFGYREGRFGAHVQCMAIDTGGSISTIPAGISYTEAAAATEGAHDARSAIRRAGIREGHRALVNGATGGIGSTGVQLSRAAGATVTAVCAGRHFDPVRGLGGTFRSPWSGPCCTVDGAWCSRPPRRARKWCPRSATTDAGGSRSSSARLALLRDRAHADAGLTDLPVAVLLAQENLVDGLLIVVA